MRVSAERLAAAAEATGFRADMLERVAQLIGLLAAIQRHPFLRGKLALKGGTALNLFVFDVPRLSVDIDLNYLGAESREAMLAERPRLEEWTRPPGHREHSAPGGVLRLGQCWEQEHLRPQDRWFHRMLGALFPTPIVPTRRLILVRQRRDRA